MQQHMLYIVYTAYHGAFSMLAANHAGMHCAICLLLCAVLSAGI